MPACSNACSLFARFALPRFGGLVSISLLYCATFPCRSSSQPCLCNATHCQLKLLKCLPERLRERVALLQFHGTPVGQCFYLQIETFPEQSTMSTLVEPRSPYSIKVLANAWNVQMRPALWPCARACLVHIADTTLLHIHKAWEPPKTKTKDTNRFLRSRSTCEAFSSHYRR